MIDAPIPIGLLLHEPLNQIHCAPVPKEPPNTDKTVESPLHIVLTPLIDVGAVDKVSTTIVNEAQAVLPPHALSARAK